MGAIIRDIAGGGTFKVILEGAIIRSTLEGGTLRGDAFREGGAYRNIGTTPSLGVHHREVDTTASSSPIAGSGSAFIGRVGNPY